MGSSSGLVRRRGTATGRVAYEPSFVSGEVHITPSSAQFAPPMGPMG